MICEWESGKSKRLLEMVRTSEPEFDKCLLPRKLEPRFKKEGILGQRELLAVFKNGKVCPV